MGQTLIELSLNIRDDSVKRLSSYSKVFSQSQIEDLTRADWRLPRPGIQVVSRTKNLRRLLSQSPEALSLTATRVSLLSIKYFIISERFYLSPSQGRVISRHYLYYQYHERTYRIDPLGLSEIKDYLEAEKVTISKETC
jgi:hypothetical protein